MKKLSIYLILSIFLIIISMSSAYALTIEGVVLDAQTKERIPYANIVLIDASAQKIGTTTNTNGYFILRNIKEDTYTLGVTHIGYLQEQVRLYAPISALEIQLEENVIEMEEIVVTEESAYADVDYVHLSGRITDENGNAIEGASISTDRGPIIASSTSSLLGNYFLSFLKQGDYRITVIKEGYELKIFMLEVKGLRTTTQEHDVTLKKISGFTTTPEEQTINVKNLCNNDYKYILLEKGEYLSDSYGYSTFIYDDSYFVDRRDLSDGRKIVYLFHQPSLSNILGNQNIFLKESTRILLYKNFPSSENNCGEQIIQVKNNQCTYYKFELKTLDNTKGFITFEICPSTQPIEGGAQTYPTKECNSNKDCPSNKPICNYDKVCVQENIKDLECIDSNGPAYLATEEGDYLQNSAQVLGGYCIYRGTEKTDTKVDDSTILYYTCTDNCNQGNRYTCPKGAMTKILDGREVGACKQINPDDLIEKESFEITILEPIEYEEDEIIVEFTEADLIENSLCGGLSPEILASLELTETSNTPTSAVIKDLTGFFLKITGKPVSSQEKTYTGKISTDAYSALANLKDPYIEVLYREKTANIAEARFLDRKLGSALLKEFKYGNDDPATLSLKSDVAERSKTGLVLRESLDQGVKATTKGYVFTLIKEVYSLKLYSCIGDSCMGDLPILEDYIPLKFVLGELKQSKYIQIGDNIYSISPGFYLIPYPIDRGISYDIIQDPLKDEQFRLYYDLPFNIPGKSYVIGNKFFNLQFLTPEEGYFLTKNIPENLETVEKTFTYKKATLKYRLVPIDKDFGDFKAGAYLVPVQTITVMDNKYSTGKRPYVRFKPGDKIVYNMKFFEEVKKLQDEKRARDERTWLTWVEEKLGDILSQQNNYPWVQKLSN